MDVDIQELYAVLTWVITGRVTRVHILSCDFDGNIDPCVNTTENSPQNSAPVVVDIPPRADSYRFNLFLYDGEDLVQVYQEEDWLIIHRSAGKGRLNVNYFCEVLIPLTSIPVYIIIIYIKPSSYTCTLPLRQSCKYIPGSFIGQWPLLYCTVAPTRDFSK